MLENSSFGFCRDTRTRFGMQALSATRPAVFHRDTSTDESQPADQLPESARLGFCGKETC